MSTIVEHTLNEKETSPVEPRKSFVTPEMIEKNPALAVAGIFAGDPAWDEIIEEIKKNQTRQRRREQRVTK